MLEKEIAPVYVALLNLLLGCDFLLSCFDEIEKTDHYRQGLKQKINLLRPEIEKAINQDLNKLWGVDDRAMYGIMDGYREHFTRLATTRPEQIAGLGELLAKFHQMPDWTLHHNGIKIVESEKAA